MDRLKVLVVDDEERMRKLISDFLKIKGYETVEAGDGEEAIDVFFADKEIALIILDVMMPKMDGWEVLKTVREHSKVPVIMLTARTVHSPKSHDFGSLAYCAERDAYFEEPTYENIDVVDRIGSGDAYISGALYGLIHSNGDVQEAVKYGNATSAMKNTIPGDLPQSSLKEIESVIRDHYSTGFHSEMDR